MKQFNFADVVIENVPYIKRGSETYLSLKKLVEKLEKEQSFSIPKKYYSNLRSVLLKDFPEYKVKLIKSKDSDFVRAYRVI